MAESYRIGVDHAGPDEDMTVIVGLRGSGRGAVMEAMEVLPAGATRDQQVLAHYRVSNSLRATGEAFGISHERVRQIAARDGHTPQTPRQKRKPNPGAAKLVELYRGGFSTAKAADRAHMSIQTARIVLDRAGVKRRKGRA